MRLNHWDQFDQWGCSTLQSVSVWEESASGDEVNVPMFSLISWSTSSTLIAFSTEFYQVLLSSTEIKSINMINKVSVVLVCKEGKNCSGSGSGTDLMSCISALFHYWVLLGWKTTSHWGPRHCDQELRSCAAPVSVLVLRSVLVLVWLWVLIPPGSAASVFLLWDQQKL